MALGLAALRTTIFRTVLGGAVFALTAADPGFYAHEVVSGDYVKKVDIDGRTRDYELHLPEGYDGTQPLPVLFVFHGSSASASVIERETSFDRLADSLGVIVAYPEGLHRGWNIGECCRYSFMHHVDESAFVSAMLDSLERGLRVDSTRVYATGFSDGGTLSYILGCQLSDRIAAVAGVSATLFDPEPRCTTSRAVPVMIIHGTGDTHVPYAGQPGGPPDLRAQHRMHSAPEVTAFWVAQDGCDSVPARTQVGHLTRERYACPGDAEVVFFTIEGGEHGWPGGGRGWIFSPEPPTDMSASDSIAAFLLRHRLADAHGPRTVTHG
jgi:polyhydroxybutyrate depolymerase